MYRYNWLLPTAVQPNFIFLTLYAEMILYRPPVYTYKVLTSIQSVQERQIYEWKLSINY